MVNKVTLIGNLGRDPEVRRLENGTPVAKFPIATNESYKDANGDWQTQTEWHDIVCWRSLAEQAERIFKKGSLVYVEGKLTHRKYTDKNGIERYITEVQALSVRSLERREGGQRENSFPSQEPPMATARTMSSPASNYNADPEFEVVAPPMSEPPAQGEDDLPF